MVLGTIDVKFLFLLKVNGVLLFFVTDVVCFCIINTIPIQMCILLCTVL